MNQDFVAEVNSDAVKSPVRVALVTRRTSVQVKATEEERLHTYPEVLFRTAIAIEVLSIVLVWVALLFSAPLEGVADPSHTPNPAKAPWYFLGLQELLHYFPPVVAGVVAPALVVIALVVIPYFNINIEAEGLFLKDKPYRVRIFLESAFALCLFLLVFKVYVALIPTLVIVFLMFLATRSSVHSHSKFRRHLAARPLSYWVMTWFLLELVALTAVGTFFRGPGWAWVWPWSN